MIPSARIRELIQAAKEGDETSFALLVEDLKPQMERVARGYASPGDVTNSTSDIVQEAGVRLWEGLDQFRGAENADDTRAMFCTWVRQIVHRTGLNAVRDQKALKRQPHNARIISLGRASPATASWSSFEPAGTESTPSVKVDRVERALRVRAALQRISDLTSRRIVYLRFFDGLSLREIADRVELGYEATRDRFRRSMQVVERALSGTELSS